MLKKPDCWVGLGLRKDIYSGLRKESEALEKELEATLISLYENGAPDLTTLLEVTKYAVKLAHCISDPDLRPKWGTWERTVVVDGFSKGTFAETPLEKKILQRFEEGHQRETHLSWSEWVGEAENSIKLCTLFWSNIKAYTIDEYWTMKRAERVAKGQDPDEDSD